MAESDGMRRAGTTGVYSEPRFLPAGDAAVVVELADEVSPRANLRVRTLERVIEREEIAGIVETVPTFCSLLIYYDPQTLSWDALIRTLRSLIARAVDEAAPPGRLVEIPCAYGGELGPDLEAAARRLELEPAELVHLHAADEYLVYFIGFTPGLPYMIGSSERLTIPRIDTPRIKVPAGSVGLGGRQCCIYSLESPGGFWLLGRTPLALYDPRRAEPILLRAGDRVHFRPIDRAEFDAIVGDGAVTSPGDRGMIGGHGKARG